MNLTNILLNHPEIAAMSAGDAVIALNAKNIQKVNNNLQTFWGYGDLYGVQAYYGLATFLEAAATQDVGVKLFRDAFINRGIDLGNAKIQLQIAAIKASAPAEVQPLIDLLAQMGVYQVSLVEEQEGVGVTAAESDFNAAMVNVNRINLLNHIDQVRGQVVGGSITTLEAFKAAL